jgi:hypothetical protein
VTAALAEQTAWQRRAVRVLADLLEQAARENLPVLGWSVGSAGIILTGRSFAEPGPARRDCLAAWAAALGIELREHRFSSGTTVITGTAGQRDSRHGFCTIVLTADIYDDAAEDTGGSGDE